MHCHIAICDDRAEDAQHVRELTEAWARSRGATLQTELFSSAESFLFRYEEDHSFDLLLLDVEMGGMDGVTMARRVRRGNEAVQIVFITGYSDYIAEGYDVAALHYLMKPVNREKLFAVLDRAEEKLRKNEKLLTLSVGGETVRVPIYQIRYADVYGNYVTLHGQSDLTVKMTLGELEKQLDERFYRAGRSLLVNLTCIRCVTRTAVQLSDGTALPLPRGAYEPLNRAIIERT